MSELRNRHHVLFNRRAWTSTNDLQLLREDPQLIVSMRVDAHKELHEAISHVPPLSYHIARRALRDFHDFNDPLDSLHSVENLQRSIEGACKHPRADFLEREVGGLAVSALQLQKPFLVDQLPATVIDLGSCRHNRKIERVSA